MIILIIVLDFLSTISSIVVVVIVVVDTECTLKPDKHIDTRGKFSRLAENCWLPVLENKFIHFCMVYTGGTLNVRWTQL